MELLRILSQHPHVQLVAITSRSEAGLPVAQMFPSLRGVVDLCFSDPTVVCSKPAMWYFCYTAWRGDGTDTCAIAAGVRVIDLGRFSHQDAQVFEQWYKIPHTCAEVLDEAVYGLTN